MAKPRIIPDIERPSRTEVDRYLKLWDSLENYKLQESSLRKLFSKTYPLNVDLDDVLIKVCALNDFYSTNIYSPFAVAKHIVALKIDGPIMRGDLTVVNKIAKIEMNGGKHWNFYSFATKYCSHHQPTIYPIYDYHVEQILLWFKRRDDFCAFSVADLRIYSTYRSVLLEFRKFYKLDSFDLKQIDKYLWQAGKKYFPRKY